MMRLPPEPRVGHSERAAPEFTRTTIIRSKPDWLLSHMVRNFTVGPACRKPGVQTEDGAQVAGAAKESRAVEFPIARLDEAACRAIAIRAAILRAEAV